MQRKKPRVTARSQRYKYRSFYKVQDQLHALEASLYNPAFTPSPDWLAERERLTAEWHRLNPFKIVNGSLYPPPLFHSVRDWFKRALSSVRVCPLP